MPSRLDPSQIRDGGEWEVYEITDTYRRSRLWLDDQQYIIRTEYLADEELLEDNRQLYNDSDGKRWGDGKVVARIPLNKFYADLAGKIREGDKDHLKWWLDQSDNRMFRTFKGRIR